MFAAIPFCRDVKVLASVMALAGLAMGCIDTVANMQLVRIYQKDSAVFLQVSPQQAWGWERAGHRGAPSALSPGPGISSPRPGRRPRKSSRVEFSVTASSWTILGRYLWNEVSSSLKWSDDPGLQVVRGI